MLNVAIIGASGYAGADLSLIVAKHPNLQIGGLYVSSGVFSPSSFLEQDNCRRAVSRTARKRIFSFMFSVLIVLIVITKISRKVDGGKCFSHF